MTECSVGRILAIVPARGGSKGVPRKNIALVAGKPLLAWTIQEARLSGVIDRLVVSTEDAEIASVARTWGGEVPFLRPGELARDDTPGIDPVVHAIDTLERQGYLPDWVMLLQPTSPLRAAEDLRGAVQLAAEKSAESVVSVCEAVPPPAWIRRITPEGLLEDADPTIKTPAVRQALAPAHALNGAIYLARTSGLRDRRSFYATRVHAYVMPRERSLDIDTVWELHLADIILRERHPYVS